MPVDTSFTTEHLPASQGLLLFRMDETGDLHFLEDYGLGSGYFGGELDEDHMVYRFNISKHIQGVIDGLRPNEELAAVVVGSSEHEPCGTERTGKGGKPHAPDDILYGI